MHGAIAQTDTSYHFFLCVKAQNFRTNRYLLNIINNHVRKETANPIRSK